MSKIAYLFDGSTDGQSVATNTLAATYITSTPAGFACTATANGAGSTITLASDAIFAKTGARALKFVCAASISQIIRLPLAAAANKVAVSMYHGATALPTANVVIATIQSSGDVGFRFYLSTTGVIVLQDSTGTTIGSTVAGAWAINRRNRIEIVADNSGGSAAGTCTLNVYNDDGTTPTGSIAVTGKNLGTVAFSKVDVGTPGSTSAAFTHWFDAVQLNDGGTAEIGPVSTNVPPSVSLGGNFTVDPNLVDTFTLTATATDSDGTIASYLIEDITSTPTTVATAATATVNVPRSVTGATRVYRVTVTDNGGANATATVTVTVLAHTRWAKLAAGLKAIRRMISAANLTNLAQGAGAVAFATTGQGRVANDRFTGNATFAVKTGQTDGPLDDTGTMITTYFEMTPTTPRTKLGYNVADNPENASPTVSKQVPVKPGRTYRITFKDVRAVAGGVTFISVRGAAPGAWIDAVGSANGAGTTLTANAWGELTGTYTVPVGASYMSLAVYQTSTVSSPIDITSRIMITEGSDYVPYRSGASNGWTWAGTPNSSTSSGPLVVSSAPSYAWALDAVQKLTWEPPFDPTSPPTGTVTCTVDDTHRHFDAGGQNVILVMPNTPVSAITNLLTYEAQVTVQNFNHLVCMGGEISVPQTPGAKLASAMDGTQTTVPLLDASMFPAVGGMVRVQGELIRYTGKSGNTLTGATRQAGFYNSGTGSSNTTHPSGADVYISERARSGLGLSNFTGIAHVEGLWVHGFVCDGIRISGSPDGSVTSGICRIQRYRCEGLTNYVIPAETDGHPDGIQTYGGGCAEVDIDQASILCGPNGNGFINKGSDGTGNPSVAKWTAKNWELVSPGGDARSMYANSDGTATVFTQQNAYIRTAVGQTVIGSSGTGINSQFQQVSYAVGQPDMVPSARVGIGYTSPGYTSDSRGFALNIPNGFAKVKEVDLSSTTNWEVRSTQVKADGVMRPANVSVGPNGLNLAAGRIGGEVSSSEVRLNGDSSLQIGNFVFLRTEVYFDPIVGGIWPAVWRRPFTGFSNGEIDDMEKFGTTTHGSLHTTDVTQGTGEYGAPGHRQQSGANFSGTQGGYHVVESLLTATTFTEWWDGVLVGTQTLSDYNANATPVNTATLWTPEFDTSTKKWQLIFSNQVNSAYGGGLPAGAYAWNFQVNRCRVYA